MLSKQKGAFNLAMSVKTFLIVLFIGLGLLLQENFGDTVAGASVLVALIVFAKMAWGN
jgi:cell division protein FtsW (lipid II flippase)